MKLLSVGKMAAIVPFVFKQKKKMTLLKGDAALAARREIASELDHSTITALRRPRRVDKPEWALMQQLWDAGLRYDPVSGMPIFNTSACKPALLDSIWNLYCGVADTINTKVLGETGAAFKDAAAHLFEHAGFGAGTSGGEGSGAP